MSKRYGRTQKRKHREYIERLSKAIERDRCLLKYTSDKKDHIEAMYGELVNRIEMAFTHSTLIEPHTVKMDCYPPQFRSRTRDSLNSHIYPDNITPQMQYEIHYTTLERVDVLSEDDAMRDARHIIVRTPNGGATYYISRQAMMMGQHQELSIHILKRIMSILAPKTAKGTPKEDNQ